MSEVNTEILKEGGILYQKAQNRDSTSKPSLSDLITLRQRYVYTLRVHRGLLSFR
jgi:hypothetical protein